MNEDKENNSLGTWVCACVSVFSSDPEFFHEALDRLHRQHAMATAIAEIRHIGMLTVDATDMKDLLMPNPLRCLDVSAEDLLAGSMLKVRIISR